MRFKDATARKNEKVARGRYLWFAWYPVSSSSSYEYIWLEWVYKEYDSWYGIPRYYPVDV